MNQEQILKLLNKENKNLFLKNRIRKTFPLGENRYNRENLGLLKVIKGKLRIYLIGENGREVTLFMLDKGEYCIMTSPCMLGNTNIEIYIKAVESTEIEVVPTRIIEKMRGNDPKLNVAILEAMGKRIAKILELVNMLLNKSIEERLIDFLLKYEGELTLSHEEIAGHIGSSREVVSRTLKSIVKKDFIKVARKKIEIVDRNGLLNYKN